MVLLYGSIQKPIPNINIIEAVIKNITKVFASIGVISRLGSIEQHIIFYVVFSIFIYLQIKNKNFQNNFPSIKINCDKLR
jgi:hypothetical protein